MMKKYLMIIKRFQLIMFGSIYGIGRYVVVPIVVLLLGSSVPVSAQENPWIFGMYTHGYHFLTGNVLELARLFVNIPVSKATDGIVPIDIVPLNLHYMSLKDNGEHVDYKMGNPYGFTSYDLFNDVEAGLKFGWQGAESLVGAYMYGAYCINQHKTRFLGNLEYDKHKIQSWKIGLGVRISPLRFLMDNYDWCPIVEFGTSYVHNFKYKGPNGSDIDQLNNGMRTNYAIGILFDEGDQSLLLCMDMAHYNLFNKNYTPDGGFWYPYANFKNKDYYFSLRYSFTIDN